MKIMWNILKIGYAPKQRGVQGKGHLPVRPSKLFRLIGVYYARSMTQSLESCT